MLNAASDVCGDLDGSVADQTNYDHLLIFLASSHLHREQGCTNFLGHA